MVSDPHVILTCKAYAQTVHRFPFGPPNELYPQY